MVVINTKKNILINYRWLIITMWASLSSLTYGKIENVGSVCFDEMRQIKNPRPIQCDAGLKLLETCFFSFFAPPAGLEPATL